MKPVKILAVHCLAFCCVATALVAVDDAAKDRLVLNTPEILKLDWGTRSLQVNDLNADGLNDIIMVNNDQTQIQFWYRGDSDGLEAGQKLVISEDRWDPVLQDAPYNEQSLTIGFPIFDLALGDLNGDGLSDLAYTSGEVPLSIRYKSENDLWSDPVEYDAFEALGWIGTVRMSDLNGDSGLDLVVLAKEGFHVLAGAEELAEPSLETYFITGENPFNLMLEDINLDGLLDVLYISSGGSKQFLSMRLQLDSGGFGPEVRFPLDRSVRMISPIPTEVDENPKFCAVDARSGSLEFFQIERSPLGSDLSENELSVEILPLFKKQREDPRYSIGDLDGDGYEDIVLSVSGTPELFWLRGGHNGFEQPRRFPTFTAITSLKQGRFFKDDARQLITLSAEESVIGLSEVDSAKRITFPRELKLIEGKPLVSEVIDWDSDGYDELALVYEVNSEYRFVLVAPEMRSSEQTTWEVIAEYTFDGLRREPSFLNKYPLLGETTPLMVLFVPREAPVIFKLDTADKDAPVVELFTESAIRQSFLKGVTPSQMSVADLDYDASFELIVGRTGYARSITIEAGELAMVDQFNAKNGTDEVHAVIPDLVQAEDGLLGLYVGNTGHFQFLKRGEDGVYRYHRTDSVGEIKLVDSPVKIQQPGSVSHLLLGDDRVWVVDLNQTHWELNHYDRYETELEDVRFSGVTVGDLNSDGIDEIIASDGQRNVIEVLSMDETSDLKRAMYWKVFEKNMHYQGRSGAKLEPREMLVAKLNSAKEAGALLLLIHDRLLIYSVE